MRTRPVTSRFFDTRRASTATDRMAATGATRAARRAGSSADTTVTTRPIANDTSSDRVDTTSGPSGIATPMAFHSDEMPFATPMPAATPTADASVPTTSASSSTERRTCRALAPMARSSASSRVRCATRIVNVLLMMNAPTSSATTANTVMKSPKKLRSALPRSAFSAVSAVPVIAWSSAGIAAATRRASSAWVTPSTRAHRDGPRRAVAPSSRSAVVGVNSTVRLPARLSWPSNVAMPTTVIVLRRGAGEHRRGVAHRQVAGVGDRPVHDDLVVGPGRVARDELEGVELLVGAPRRTRRRGPVVQRLERLAVAAEHLGEALDARRHRGHAVHGGDPVGQRGGHRPTLVAGVVRDGDRAADQHVGAALLVLEGAGEGRPHGVGEDQGAGHEGDAEQDGDAGRQQPALVRHQAAQGQPGDGAHRSAPRGVEALQEVEDALRGRRDHVADDLAVGEEDHAVGVRRRHRVVGDHDDRLAHVVDGAAQERQHLRAGARVEVAGGLVGEDDLGPGHQGAGDGDPLLLAAGQLRGPVRQPVARGRRRRRCAPATRRPRCARRAPAAG